MNLAQIECDQLHFAELAKQAARRGGGRAVTNPELIRCNATLRLLTVDVGAEAVTHGIELPAKAWTPALEAHLIKNFKGSAELAIRQLGATL